VRTYQNLRGRLVYRHRPIRTQTDWTKVLYIKRPVYIHQPAQSGERKRVIATQHFSSAFPDTSSPDLTPKVPVEGMAVNAEGRKNAV
jgi:hypothetical protein